MQETEVGRFVQMKPKGLAVEDVCKWQVGFVYNSTAEQRVQSEESPLLPRVLLYLCLHDQVRTVKAIMGEVQLRTGK